VSRWKTPLGVVLLLLAAAISVARQWDYNGHGAAYAFGAGLGTVLLAFALVLVGVYLLRRFGGLDPTGSRAPLLPVGLLALGLAFTAASGEARKREEDRAHFVDAGHTCTGNEAEPLTKAPEGLTYAPLQPEEAGVIESLAQSAKLPTESFSGREVLVGRKSAGIVMVIPGAAEGADRLTDFRKGADDAARSQGFTVTQSSVAGEAVSLAVSGGAAEITGSAGCYGFLVASSSRTIAVDVATAIIREGQT
jgi:hypothetical protein